MTQYLEVAFLTEWLKKNPPWAKGDFNNFLKLKDTLQLAYKFAHLKDVDVFVYSVGLPPPKGVYRVSFSSTNSPVLSCENTYFKVTPNGRVFIAKTPGGEKSYLARFEILFS